MIACTTGGLVCRRSTARLIPQAEPSLLHIYYRTKEEKSQAKKKKIQKIFLQEVYYDVETPFF